MKPKQPLSLGPVIAQTGIFLLICILLYSGSLFYRNYQAHAYNRAEQWLSNAQTQYIQAVTDRRLITDYLPYFHRLEKLGIIGDETRLDWIKALQAISQQLNLPAIHYHIAPQTESGFNVVHDTGNFHLYGSLMKVQVELYHEGELLTLLDDLNHYGRGLFTVTACTLTRREEALHLDATKPNLSADCDLTWLTLNVTDAKGKAVL